MSEEDDDYDDDDVDEEPYEGGWIVKVKMSDASELDDLKGAEEYLSSIEED